MDLFLALFLAFTWLFCLTLNCCFNPPHQFTYPFLPPPPLHIILQLCPFKKGIWVVIQRRVRVDPSPVAINKVFWSLPCWCFCMQFPGSLPSLQIRTIATQSCRCVCGDFLLWTGEFLQQETWIFVHICLLLLRGISRLCLLLCSSFSWTFYAGSLLLFYRLTVFNSHLSSTCWAALTRS